MASADTSSSQLRYLKEASWGVTPAIPMNNMRITGESLIHNKETVSSQEIRSDRQIPDVVEVAASNSGGVNFEVSYAAYDDFFEGIMGASWGAQVLSDDISATFVAAGPTIAGTGIHTSRVVGDIIRVSGTANNDGFYELVTVATDLLTVATAVVDEAAVTCDIDSIKLSMGTTAGMFEIEKEFSDLGAVDGKFLNHLGLVPNVLTLSFTTKRILTGTMSFLGRSVASSSTTAGTGAAIAAPTNDVMNATAGIGRISENGAILTTALLGLELTLNANLQLKPQLGNRYPYEIGLGSLLVTGNVDAYYENATLYNKSINHDATDLWWAIHDNPTSPELGNTYVFAIKRMRFTAGGPQSGAINQAVRQRLDFQGILEATSGTTMEIFKYAAATP